MLSSRSSGFIALSIATNHHPCIINHTGSLLLLLLLFSMITAHRPENHVIAERLTRHRAKEHWRSGDVGVHATKGSNFGLFPDDGLPLTARNCRRPIQLRTIQACWKSTNSLVQLWLFTVSSYDDSVDHWFMLWLCHLFPFLPNIGKTGIAYIQPLSGIGHCLC